MAAIIYDDNCTLTALLVWCQKSWGTALHEKKTILDEVNKCCMIITNQPNETVHVSATSTENREQCHHGNSITWEKNLYLKKMKWTKLHTYSSWIQVQKHSSVCTPAVQASTIPN